ncbi:ABC transporter permease [Haloarchaeobius baliensis]|uniref:ABC transporter permease n=1 Tax=Haloarchaeobius baliensis TaxID=1670458 RepID=UPI003F883B27
MSDTGHRFEDVDWDEVAARRGRPSPRTLTYATGLLLLTVGFLYDTFLVHGRPTFVAVGPRVDLGFFLVTPLTWDLGRLDWLFLLSLLTFACYVLWPLAVDGRLRRRLWREFRGRPVALACLCYLVVVFVVGLFGPFVWTPDVNFSHSHQPPVFARGPAQFATPCVGPETRASCYGSWQYPLGTDPFGYDMWAVLVSGAHVAVKVSLVTATLIVPVATFVGTVAGYVGGRLDSALMGYVDVQQTIPAFVAYIVLSYWGRSLFLFVLVFGLLSWGGLARLVRSEAVQRRETGYVLAARSAGAADSAIVARHIVPNVSNAVLTGLTRQIPLIILVEAAISYMDMNDIMVISWGETISGGLHGTFAYFPEVWWPVLFPVAALTLTVVACSIVGDVLRDALDPRSG